MLTSAFPIFEDSLLRLPETMTWEQLMTRRSDIVSGRYTHVGNGTSTSYIDEWLPGKKHDMSNDLTLRILCLLKALGPLSRRRICELLSDINSKLIIDHIREMNKAF
jgi:hypothetical protein